jgi:hypothetical protein
MNFPNDNFVFVPLEEGSNPPLAQPVVGEPTTYGIGNMWVIPAVLVQYSTIPRHNPRYGWYGTWTGHTGT